MSQESWIGKNIGGRYAISELLGQGGMSAVYRANDPNLRRVVAVKLIHSHLSDDPEFVRRFEEEAAAVASLRHPNIIQVYDFNHDGDTYFIVFEFIPGESLQSHLQRTHDAGRTLPNEKTIEIVSSIGDALDYAHQRGMVHRDIKPANIMLNVQGDAILMDFGIVKMVGGDSHTATGAVLGTARYISPEQIKGQVADGRADIYSLGVVLFEMVGGRPPFQADSALTLLMMHVNDPVPDLRQIRSDVPPDLEAIINKALAKDRDQRFQSAAEFAAALRGARLQGGVPTTQGMAAAVAASQIATKPETPAYSPGSSQQATVPDAMPTARPEVNETGQPAGAPVAPLPRATTAPPPASTPDQGQSKSGGKSIALIGGIGAVLLVILCIAAAAIIFGSGLLNGNGDDEATTETAVAAVQETQDAAASETAEEAIADSLATDEVATATLPPATPTIEPSPTTEPTPTIAGTATTGAATQTPAPYTPTPTYTPTALESQSGPQIRINSIVGQGEYYVIDYTPTGYTPALPGTHIHFFWNTVPPENAGVSPNQETWYLYGGPNPFLGYSLTDRPAGATQVCALVANPDHTVQQNTGNCVDLP